MKYNWYTRATAVPGITHLKQIQHLKCFPTVELTSSMKSATDPTSVESVLPFPFAVCFEGVFILGMASEGAAIAHGVANSCCENI